MIAKLKNNRFMSLILQTNKMIKTVFFNSCLLLPLFSLTHFDVKAQGVKTVVIDAGHGGKDPGCNGASSNEKTVCLSLALALGEMITANYADVKVVYTRDKDIFVELDDRAKIANKNKADLFICIHANSASPSAYGSETYVLGLHRSEAQQKIAERENATIYLESDGGQKYKDYDMSPDAIIARQIQLSVNLDLSINFATKVQSQFKKLGRHDRGVKQAGFLVLYKTTMPSVLIETGFLTNREEELFLNNKENQKKMADAMFVAFEKYKAEMEGRTYAERVNGKPTTITPIVTKPTSSEATTETAKAISTDEKDQVVFRVQIHTSPKKIPTSNGIFKNLEIYEYFQDNIYKYTTGNFKNDYKSANTLKNEVRSKGFEHAFVVAFLNGERINLEKAIKLAEK